MTPEGVFETIGMNSSSTSIIREAREYLLGRYSYWLDDSKRYPDHIPNIRPVNLDGIEEEIERRREEQLRSDTWSRYQFRRNSPLVQRDSNLSANAVRNLASMTARGIVSQEILERGCNEDRWEVPSSNSSAVYAVTLNNSDNTLSCTCRGFRTGNRMSCPHTINVARYLTASRDSVKSFL